MKKKYPILLISLLISLIVFSTQILNAQTSSSDELYIKSEIQTILSTLSDNLNRFEYLQKLLENTGKDDKNYDEHKNIWISTTLAINAIASVCEYENDLLTLFMDLKEKRRVHYFDVRIRSLETSIKQITIMSEQIQINNKLMPPDLAERQLYDNLKKNIDSSIDLLEKSKDLIIQLKKK
ncbi:MAG: hypothetical protein KKF96_01755 [Proteobacteria bacterium]|nr:hypothetical protein [Pseudomonadota bacterium]